MKISAFLTFFAAILLLACQPSPKGQKPDAETAQRLLEKIIRYTGHLPKKATHETKFDSAFNEFYAQELAKHRIDLYYRNERTGDIYLLVSRIAPSLTVKRVATGIHMRMEGDSIAYYNEVFRTWKMPEPELAEKASMLFEKMVRGQDLSQYYPQNSDKEYYIEFPDPNTRFDVEKRRWVSNLEVTPEKMREAFQEQ
ncbi:MAG: hypothetical protein RMJ33_10780 [Saprospiraceae bacterium]|nr:hypothetical protein [Saprospiraceae bacterium]MDW8230312.1 hypothetical protein [Saprospiraceae bacterium]